MAVLVMLVDTNKHSILSLVQYEDFTLRIVTKGLTKVDIDLVCQDSENIKS